MTINEALDHADHITAGRNVTEATARAVMTLAAEVRRLRAGVEAVRALPLYGIDGDMWLRDDVLRILEATDGD